MARRDQLNATPHELEVFESYWGKIQLDDIEGHEEWVDDVKRACWKHWSSLKFIYLFNAASGHSTTELQSTTLDKQEYSAMLKVCKLLLPSSQTFKVGDIDFLFMECDSRYEYGDSPKGALMLYEFLDVLVRTSVARFGMAHRNAKRHPKAVLPGCFVEMLEDHILKYQGEALGDEGQTKLFLGSTAVKQTIVENEEALRAVFDGIRMVDEGGDELRTALELQALEKQGRKQDADELRRSSEQVSMAEWLSLFIKGHRVLVKGVTRAQAVKCFALAQDINDDADTGIGHVEHEMLRMLDFQEFCVAVSRLAITSIDTSGLSAGQAANRAAAHVGAFIDKLIASRPVRDLREAERFERELAATRLQAIHRGRHSRRDLLTNSVQHTGLGPGEGWRGNDATRAVYTPTPVVAGAAAAASSSHTGWSDNPYAASFNSAEAAEIDELKTMLGHKSSPVPAPATAPPRKAQEPKSFADQLRSKPKSSRPRIKCHAPLPDFKNGASHRDHGEALLKPRRSLTCRDTFTEVRHFARDSLPWATGPLGGGNFFQARETTREYKAVPMKALQGVTAVGRIHSPEEMQAPRQPLTLGYQPRPLAATKDPSRVSIGLDRSGSSKRL